MRNHSQYLDGIRGLAALSIVVLHTWLYADPETKGGFFDLAFHELRLGLICFFVLSGYLLYRGFIKERAPDTKQYFKRRFYRILPAYYVSMVGAFIIMGLVAPERLPEAVYWPVFLVFGQNFFDATVGTVNPPTWTLAIEMSFYIVLPFIGYCALRLARTLGGQILIPVGLLAFGVGFNYWFASQGTMPRVLVFSLPTMIYYFAAGMAAAVVQRYCRVAIAPALYLIGGAAFISLNIYLHQNADPIWIKTFRDLPAALGFALIILSLPKKREAGRGWQTLAFFGLTSYGMYLWHMPILIALSNLSLLPESVPLALLIALPLSCLFGALSWYWVEKPFIERSTSRRARRKESSGRSAPATLTS